MRNKRVHVPIRTCISCGAKRSKGELIRIALNSRGVAVYDINSKTKGRGAYVCPNASCLEVLKNSKRLSRAFNTEVFMANDF